MQSSFAVKMIHPFDLGPATRLNAEPQLSLSLNVAANLIAIGYDELMVHLLLKLFKILAKDTCAKPASFPNSLFLSKLLGRGDPLLQIIHREACFEGTLELSQNQLVPTQPIEASRCSADARQGIQG